MVVSEWLGSIDELFAGERRNRRCICTEVQAAVVEDEE